MKKKLIRTKLLRIRLEQAPHLKRRRDKNILSRLCKFGPCVNAKILFSYVTHRGEVDTLGLFERFIGKKKIIVPKIKGGGICLYELLDHINFARGALGIPEPLHCLRNASLETIDLALIPGVAFDMSGHRIGYGGGYFDRLLKNKFFRTARPRAEREMSEESGSASSERNRAYNKVHCTTIGLAYEFQIIDKIPAHPYDVPVDYIITERRIIRCHDQLSKPRTRRLRKSLPAKRSARRRV